MPALSVAHEAASPAEVRLTGCPACGADHGAPVCQSRVQMQVSEERFGFVACGDCGLVYLSPRVPESGIGRYYAGYLPHRGPAAWGRWAGLVQGAEERVDEARVRTVLRLGALGPSQAVLDVGCGRPSFLQRLHARTGVRAVGTDFEAGGWADAPAAWQGLSLHAGILEELPLDGAFDRMTLWHVLEHLYRPVDTLRYLRGLARPGTALIVEVPDHDGLTRRRQGSCWAGYHTPRHTAAYTPATLRGTLERAGWRVEQQYRWGTLDPYVLWWLGEQERRQRSFEGSLEDRFVPFVLGKIAALPLTLVERWLPLGFQTAIAVA